jgi:O-antigen/teichoic acid export membrane protein
VLRIIAFSLVPFALAHMLSVVLVASLREKTTLRILVVDFAAGLVLGTILISSFGVLGAGLALFLTRSIDFVQNYLRVTEMSRMALGKLLWKPMVASACMIAYLLALRAHVARSLAVEVATGAALYCAVLIALALWSAGGPTQLKAKYLYQWSE